jgi:HEAT repeat protein
MKLFSRLPKVQKLKSKGDVPGLIKALDYRENESIRIMAAQALGEFMSFDTTVPLLRAMATDSPAVRAACISALVRTHTSKANALTEWLNDPTLGEPAEEILVLLENWAIPDLLDALFDSNKRQSAQRILTSLGERTIEPSLNSKSAEYWYYTRNQTLSSPGKRISELAVKTLKSIKPSNSATNEGRLIIAHMLLKFSDLSAALMLQELKHEDFRSAIAEAIHVYQWKPSNEVERLLCACALLDWNELRQFGEAGFSALMIMRETEDAVTKSSIDEALTAIGQAYDQEFIRLWLTRFSSGTYPVSKDAETMLKRIDPEWPMNLQIVKDHLPLIHQWLFKPAWWSTYAFQIIGNAVDITAIKPILELLRTNQENHKKQRASKLHRSDLPNCDKELLEEVLEILTQLLTKDASSISDDDLQILSNLDDLGYIYPDVDYWYDFHGWEIGSLSSSSVRRLAQAELERRSTLG